MSDFVITHPRFMNATIMKAVLDYGHKQVTIEFNVPENDALGVNKYFDLICEQFDLNELRENFKKALIAHEKNKKSLAQKQRNQVEFERLRVLFDEKARIFDMPFMKDIDSEARSAVRRAPDMFALQAIANGLLQQYLKENNLSYSDYLDVLEEQLYNNLDNEVDG